MPADGNSLHDCPERDRENPDARSLIERLVEVARVVVSGLGLGAVGPALYDSLTGTDDRARLFRAGLGLRGSLSRDDASRLAEEVEHVLRGTRDHTFDKQMVLARLLDNLVQCAHDSAEELRAEGIPITAANLETKILFAVANSRPQSDIVPAEVTQLEAERALADVARWFLKGCRQ